MRLFLRRTGLHLRGIAENGNNKIINTVWAIVHDGRIVPLDKITAPEGTRVLVTLLLEDEADFWQGASSAALDAIWDNAEDDQYAELLAS